MYRFLAKNDQHEMIAYAILDKYGQKCRLSKYSGPRGSGIMVEFEPPEGVSRRSIDRYLYSCNIPGTKSRRNKFPLIKIDSTWNVELAFEKGIQVGDIFRCVYNGKFRKATINQQRCECCGPRFEICFLN